MNTDFRIAVGMTTHPKTIKLMRRCGDRAFFCLINLWSWAALHKPDGNFAGMDGEDVEIIAGWEGEEGAFAEQLCAVGFMDCDNGNFSLHDWLEHNPWAAGSDERSDAGRMNKLKGIMPDKWAELAGKGITGISKGDYEAIKKVGKKVGTSPPSSPPSSPTQTPFEVGSSEPFTPTPTPTPSPSPSPSPSPTPNVKEKEIVAAVAATPTDSCPHENIIAAYHEILPQCPKVKRWGEASRKTLRTRWREDKDRQSIEWWREFFTGVAASNFLTGKVNGGNGSSFIASLNWLLRPTSMEKVLNGNYSNSGDNANSSASCAHTCSTCQHSEHPDCRNRAEQIPCEHWRSR